MFGIPEKIAAIAGVSLSAVLAATLAFTIITKNDTISDLNDSINKPVTGYIARIDKANRDLGTCQSNTVTLRNSINTTNAAIENIQNTAGRQTEEARRSLAETRRVHNRTIERIEGAQSGEDLCTSAEDLIREAVEDE